MYPGLKYNSMINQNEFHYIHDRSKVARHRRYACSCRLPSPRGAPCRFRRCREHRALLNVLRASVELLDHGCRPGLGMPRGAQPSVLRHDQVRLH